MRHVRILTKSSFYPGNGLTTFELTYPRIIHAEMMTHRCKSINSANSRAIPVERMLEAADKFGDTVIEHWGANQPGMQADEELDEMAIQAVKNIWTKAREQAVGSAACLKICGAHKQIANRLIEPFSHITVIATFPEIGLRNFFALRANPAAQPEFQCLAYDMLEAWLDTPYELLRDGEWHMPMIDPDDARSHSTDACLKIATGRIARVSYLTHEGKRDPIADMDLHDKLMKAGHWSPFEHCAQAQSHRDSGGNFGPGWLQYRKTFVDELKVPTDTDLSIIAQTRPEWTKKGQQQ